MAGPTWYDENYLYRAPIVVDGSATAAGTVDATITIPETHPFWLTVQSTGYDVRFTTNNGYTLLAYNRRTWTYASKVGVFDINAITHHTTNTMTVIWIYWGYAAAADGSTSPSISGALNAYLYVGAMADPQFAIRLEPVGSTSPTQQVQKTTSEALALSWQFPPMIKRTIPWEGTLDFEGPRTLSSGTSPGLSHLTSQLRLGLDRDRLFIRSLFSGGTDGTNDDAYVQVVTTDDRTLRGTANIVHEDL